MTGGLKENPYRINASEIDKRNKFDLLNRESSGCLFKKALCMRNCGRMRLPLKVGVAKFFPYIIISLSSLSMRVYDRARYCVCM